MRKRRVEGEDQVRGLGERVKEEVEGKRVKWEDQGCRLRENEKKEGGGRGSSERVGGEGEGRSWRKRVKEEVEGLRVKREGEVKKVKGENHAKI